MTLYRVVCAAKAWVGYWKALPRSPEWNFPKLYTGDTTKPTGCGFDSINSPNCLVGLFIESGYLERHDLVRIPLLGLLIGEEVCYFKPEHLEEITEETKL